MNMTNPETTAKAVRVPTKTPTPSCSPGEKSRFASFLLPFVDRGEGPTIYHGIMLKQLGKLGTQRLALIADEPYYSLPAPWGQEVQLGDFRVRLPGESEFEATPRFVIPRKAFAELEQRCCSHLEILRVLFSEEHPPLRAALEEILQDLLRRDKLEAVLTWCNIPSLNLAAGRFGLPVIHNELGPFRPPLYKGTIYFDFQGVNGNTSASVDMARFIQEAGASPDFRPLSLAEIRSLLADSPHVSEPSTEPPLFKRGVALQVEHDSNLVVFGNGMTNFGAIHAARTGIGPGDLLIRHHPSGQALYTERLGVMDDSPDSVTFLRQCEKVVTINSSVAFECLLQEKPVTILGDSPASALSREKQERMSDSDRLLALNYLFLCYLVPARFLFDVDYYHWRLSRPSLLDIYQKHVEAFRTEMPAPPVLSLRLENDRLPVSPQAKWSQSLWRELEQARTDLRHRTTELDQTRVELRERGQELDTARAELETFRVVKELSATLENMRLPIVNHT